MAPEPSWWSCKNLTGNQSNEFGNAELGRMGSKYSTERKQSHQGGKTHQWQSQNSSRKAGGGDPHLSELTSVGKGERAAIIGLSELLSDIQK